MNGILFNECLFPRVVDGTKTQTRRIMKPQTADSYKLTELNCIEDDKPMVYYGFYTKEQYDKLSEWHKTTKNYTFMGKEYNRKHFAYPRFKVGERVFLKEPCKILTVMNGIGVIRYQDKAEKRFEADFVMKIVNQQDKSKTGYANKMPEWAARYFIEITGVSAERLQDISDEDCFKEGIKIDRTFPDDEVIYLNGLQGFKKAKGEKHYKTPREAFAALIDKTCGKGTWKSNPFVWVYDFKNG